MNPPPALAGPAAPDVAVGLMLASSSTICALLGVRDQEKGPPPTMNPFGVNVSSRPRAPHRGSDEIPNPVALPQALHHHRVSSTCWRWRPSPAISVRAAGKGRLETEMNLGGLRSARSQRRGMRGSKRGLSPCGGGEGRGGSGLLGSCCKWPSAVLWA